MLIKVIVCLILAVLGVLLSGLVIEGTFRGVALTGRFVLMTAAGGGLALQTVNYRPGRVYLRLAVR